MKTLHLKFFYIQKTVLKISLLKSNSGEVVVKGFAGGSMVKNLPANAGDAGDRVLIPGLGRSPGCRANKSHIPQLLSLCS